MKNILLALILLPFTALALNPSASDVKRASISIESCIGGHCHPPISG